MVALFLPESLRAQETRGRITGRVSDASRAPVAGASVTVTDLARGTTATSTTSAEGLFEVNYLLPGTYEVVLAFAGFRTHIQSMVSLQMTETRDLAIVLEVGGVEETITVRSDRPALNTSDASLGLTVDQRRIAELPLIHGDPYKMCSIMA